jgi:uncharacterized membrane protein
MKLSAWPKSNTPPKVFWSLGGIFCGFALYFTVYTISRHAAFETAGYDLGNFSQSIWNTSRGHLMRMTTAPGATSRWAFHFEPILFLLVPIYAIFPSPVILVVLQTLIVTIGALPIFWIARDLLRSDWAGVLYAAVYLMLPALQAAVIFDFHGVTLAMSFLAFALWSLLKKEYIAFGVWSLLVMSCKEDMPLLVLMMGLYILFIQRQWREGAITVVASMVWFAMANFVIIPFYSPDRNSIYITRYSNLGNSLQAVILGFFTHPLRVLAIAFESPKLPYWTQLTMPVAFTSLLDPLLLLLSLPSLAINTLSNNSATYRPDTFHYTAPIVPFIIASSIRGIDRLSRRLGRDDENLYSLWQMRLLILVIGASLGYHIMAGYTPLRIGFRWPSPDGHDILAQQMLDKIPPDASVSAQNALVPRLANRPYIYIFPKIEDAEYIALDTQSSYYPFGDREELCGEIRRLVVGTSYGAIYFADELLLLQRDVPDEVEVSLADICNKAPQPSFLGRAGTINVPEPTR